MEVKISSLGALTDSVVPALNFKAEISALNNEIPLNLSIVVYSEDNRLLSLSNQILDPMLLIGKSIQDQVLSVLKATTVQTPQPNETKDFQYNMIAELAPIALDYLEKVRMKNRKRDVVLNFHISVDYLQVQVWLANLAKYKISGIGSTQNAIVMASSQRDPNINLLEQVNELLVLKRYLVKYPLTIYASVWINDFSPYLGLGKYFIVEVPQILEEINTTSVSADIKVLADRINGAERIIHKMEDNLRKGEWDLVVEDSRKFWELFKEDVKGKIKELITNSTGISQDYAGKFTQALDNLHEYASSLHHSTEKNKDGGPKVISNFYTGGKEDAFLVFLMAVSIYNLLSSKLSKIFRPNSGEVK